MNKLIFGIMLMLLVLFVVPAAAEDYNKFYFVPEDSSCDPGNNVTVWVIMNTSYTDINAGQASIIYDPSVVSLALIEEGTPDWYMWDYHIYDYGTNLKYVMIGASDVMGTFGPGELQLAKITLHGEAEGISSLHFGDESEVGSDHLTQISGQGGIYPHTTQDGTFTCGSAQTFSKELPAGWNLISLPLTPTDNSVSAILSGVEQNAVKQYNAVTKEFEDTTIMDPGTGYFVQVTSASTWEYVGDSAPSTTTQLKSGLNMIGVPNCGMSVSAAMGSTGYRYAARWNATSQSYEVYNPNAPAAFHGFTTMEAGEGYFVSATSDSTLTVACP